MKKSVKWLIGIVAILIVIGSVYFSGGIFQKGAIIGRVSKIPTGSVPKPPLIAVDRADEGYFSQLVAGSTNVNFGSYELRNNSSSEVRIRRIFVREVANNVDGITNIGIYEGSVLLNGVTKRSLGDYGDPMATVLDYSTRPIVIAPNSIKNVMVKANTLYSASSGQDANLVSIFGSKPLAFRRSF